jgi:hypothetical protein
MDSGLAADAAIRNDGDEIGARAATATVRQADLNENIVSWARLVGRIHSLRAALFKQDSLIFVCCIDFSPRYGEIHDPIDLRSDRGI